MSRRARPAPRRPVAAAPAVAAAAEPEAGAVPPEGSPAFAHRSVLLDEVIDRALACEAARGKGAWLLDTTLGGGGHAAALLEALPHARLLGVDRDARALEAAGLRLARFGDRVTTVCGRLGALPAVLERLQIGGGVALLLADFGVSSHQIDTPERGFSWRFDAPLDMRMGAEGITARAWLAEATEAEIADTLFTLGEERFARRIARAIAQLSPEARPATTLELAALVARCIPRATWRPGHHPATRTFQALRIRVNQELEDIAQLMQDLPGLLHPGGLALCISFHSLEDRLVKKSIAQAARTCVCPPRLPVCTCSQIASLRPLPGGSITAGALECAANPRARSARMRGARRL